MAVLFHLLNTRKASKTSSSELRFNLSGIFCCENTEEKIISDHPPGPASIHLGKLAAVIPEATQTSLHLASATQSRENSQRKLRVAMQSEENISGKKRTPVRITQS